MLFFLWLLVAAGRNPLLAIKSPSNYCFFSNTFSLFYIVFSSNSPKDFILIAAGFNLRRKK